MVRTTTKFAKFVSITTAFALLCSSAAMALPTGGNVTSGSATITDTANTTTINQTSHGANINWGTFGSAGNEAINFNQPNSSAYTINKVTGGVPSVLNGAMNANGRIVVMNDAGITFGAGSQTNVGALVATTARNISMGANDTATFSDISNAAIVNNGAITAARGGAVIINAENIVNNGTITADRGLAALGATQGFTVTTDGKINYQPGTNVDQSIITNNGTISARGGVVNITSEQARNITQSVINLNGVIDVSCLECGNGANARDTGGKVEVASLGGDVNANGIIKSNGGQFGGGGDISLYAEGNMNVGSGANITANGGTTQGNGGNINFHGDSFTFQPAANVDANVTLGTGGKITIGSNHDTHIVNGASGALNAYSKNTIADASKKGVSVEINGHNVIVDDAQGGTLNGGDGNIILRTVDKNGNLFNDGSVKFVNKNDTISTRSGSVQMAAGSGGIDAGNITSTGDDNYTSGSIQFFTTNGGNVAVNNVTVVSNSLASTGNQLVISSDGNATITGKVYVSTTDLIQSANDSPTASVAIIAKNNVLLNNDVQVIAYDNYRPSINPTASLYVEAGHGAGVNQTGNITTLGQVYVYALGHSALGDIVQGHDEVTSNAQFFSKGSILAAKDIFVQAKSEKCMFPVFTHANLEIIAQNGNIDTTQANIASRADAYVATSHADAKTTINALNGDASIKAVGSIATSRCCEVGQASGQSTALTIVYANNITFNGAQDPYSTANYHLRDANQNLIHEGELYQGRVSGLTTDGNDVAEVRINQHPVTPPPVTCQDNCTSVPVVPLVNLPPSTLANLEPASGNGNFCTNVNISSLPGLCYPEAPHVVELEPAAGPIPFRFGPAVAPKKFAELKPKSGRCINVKKPNGGKDVVCIKDEIDK